MGKKRRTAAADSLGKSLIRDRFGSRSRTKNNSMVSSTY